MYGAAALNAAATFTLDSANSTNFVKILFSSSFCLYQFLMLFIIREISIFIFRDIFQFLFLCRNYLLIYLCVYLFRDVVYELNESIS